MAQHRSRWDVEQEYDMLSSGLPVRDATKNTFINPDAEALNDHTSKVALDSLMRALRSDDDTMHMPVYTPASEIPWRPQPLLRKRISQDTTSQPLAGYFARNNTQSDRHQRSREANSAVQHHGPGRRLFGLFGGRKPTESKRPNQPRLSTGPTSHRRRDSNDDRHSPAGAVRRHRA